MPTPPPAFGYYNRNCSHCRPDTQGAGCIGWQSHMFPLTHSMSAHGFPLVDRGSTIRERGWHGFLHAGECLPPPARLQGAFLQPHRGVLGYFCSRSMAHDETDSCCWSPQLGPMFYVSCVASFVSHLAVSINGGGGMFGRCELVTVWQHFELPTPSPCHPTVDKHPMVF